MDRRERGKEREREGKRGSFVVPSIHINYPIILFSFFFFFSIRCDVNIVINIEIG